MIYSCFNEKAGHYEYFEDDRALAMNGDFPVPQLGNLQAGRVGVPARDAGRSLPRDVRRTGVGWHARGAVVQCQNTPMRGLSGGALGAHPLPAILGLAIIGMWGGVGAISGASAAYLGDKKAWQGALAGAVAGIAGGIATSYATMDMGDTNRGAQQALRLVAPVAAGAPAGYFVARDR